VIPFQCSGRLVSNKIRVERLLDLHIEIYYNKGPFGKALAPASLALDPDPREELILLILLENQNHF
jgi:hypothetical protein